MSAPFIKVDLHGLRQEEAIRVIDRAIASADPSTYQIQLIHGYNRGTSLRSMIYEEYRYKGSSRNLKSQKEWESFVAKVKKMTTI